MSVIEGSDNLRCGECDREIQGLTGLDELHNLRAHYAEHHDISLDIEEALMLRVQLEKEQGRA